VCASLWLCTTDETNPTKEPWWSVHIQTDHIHAALTQIVHVRGLRTTPLQEKGFVGSATAMSDTEEEQRPSLVRPPSIVVPSGFTGVAGLAWASSDPAATKEDLLDRLPSDRRELEAMADRKTSFSWGFVKEMRASMARSKSGVFRSPLAASASRQSVVTMPGSQPDDDDSPAVSARKARDSRVQFSVPNIAESDEESLLDDEDEEVDPFAEQAIDDGVPSHPGDEPLQESAEDKYIAHFVLQFEDMSEERQERWFTRALQQLEWFWEEAHMAARDREIFHSAHCEAPWHTTKAVAISQHLSLLAVHVSSIDAIKAAIRAREHALQLLHRELLDFDKARPRPAQEDVALVGPSLEDEIGAISKPFSDEQLPGWATAGQGPAETVGTKDPKKPAILDQSGKPELAGGKWQARGVEHQSGIAALKLRDSAEAGDIAKHELTPEERRLVLKYRSRCRALMLRILRTSVDATEAITQWRQTMWRPHAFLWKGRSYLRKMRKDLAFVAQEPASGLLDYMGVPRDEVRILLSFHAAPAYDGRGTQLFENDESSKIGSVIALCTSELLIPDLRIVNRIDKCLALVHSEKELQRRLRRETEELEQKGLFVPVLRWRMGGESQE
jgi:hypothetical protein